MGLGSEEFFYRDGLGEAKEKELFGFVVVAGDGGSSDGCVIRSSLRGVI